MEARHGEQPESSHPRKEAFVISSPLWGAHEGRRSRLLPTYVCQRDGIEHARRICQAVPGAVLDDRIGQLLIDTLTPLAIEAALTVTAELQHRAAEADALRAAHVERARYHAGLAPDREIMRSDQRAYARAPM